MYRSVLCAIGLAGFASVASADDTTPKLHPIEAACVDYEVSGQMQNGTTTRCHRKFAYEQYEIQNLSVGFGGYTQTQNQHAITIGDTIYAINLDTNTGTKTKNPIYASIVASMANSDPEDATNAFLAAMGFTSTGEVKTIAGMNCTVHNSSLLGAGCLTADGLMLEQVFMGNTWRAVSVSIEDGGDDANYKLYQTVDITDGPDISAIMNMMNPQEN